MPFDEDSPLADWGYCQDEVDENSITKEKLQEIERQAKNGDYAFLNKKDIPLYEFSDEGCERFKDKEDHNNK